MNRRRCALSLSFMLLSLAPAAAQPAQEARTVRLDGRIGDQEWTGAARHDLVGGGTVLMRWEADGLHLAVRGEASGWSHVYLLRGDTLRVLHASAALGTATYVRRAAGHWERTASFEWAVRDTTFTPAAEAVRAAFFTEEGWLANTSEMGARQTLEFRIAPSLVDPSTPYLAVLFASDPARPYYCTTGRPA